jgi:tetratricopeptide (TPR) repeat protein
LVNRPLHSGRICRACAALLCACATLAAGVPNPAAELIEHGQVAMRSDPEVSRADADRALALLARQPDPDLEIKARLLRCDYFAERDRRAAEKEAALAMALLPQAARKGLAAGVLVCQGEILETVGENDQARSLYEQAVMAATETGDDEMLALSLYQRGYMLGLNGDYASGLTDLDRAKKLYETLGEPAHALTALGGIAILYNRLGDYAEARRIYTHTLKAQQAAGLEREQAVTLHNLGRAHENLGEWGAASQAFAAALEIAKRIDYPRGEAYALRGLGAVANAQNSPRRALRILARAQVVQAETPDARLKARIALARGIAQRATGDYVASIK